MNDIFEPLVLSAGSHTAGSGKGCAMNVVSWENGDVEITDYPSCSDPFLAGLVQAANDMLADPETALLSAADSLTVLELGHMTVGTGKAYAALGPRRYTENLREVVLPIVERTRTLVTEHPYEDHEFDIDALNDDIKWLGKTTSPDEVAEVAEIVLGWCLTISHAALFPVPDGWNRQWRVDLAREVITRFKEVMGVESPVIDPKVTAEAVERMRVVA